jgi:hypothetical protein
MEKMKVRELMIPIDQFPKISDSATFFEAVTTLETAQEKFLSGKSGQRILLVENDQGKIIGKISPIDMFRGLEANYNQVNVEETLKRYGYKDIWETMKKDYQLWEDPFKDLCRKAVSVRVKDFIQPSEGQLVTPEDKLTKCFHLFVMHRYDSLFVSQNDEIIGLIRFSDVYRKVSQTMKACTL